MSLDQISYGQPTLVVLHGAASTPGLLVRLVAPVPAAVSVRVTGAGATKVVVVGHPGSLHLAPTSRCDTRCCAAFLTKTL
ncbi:hypothetical protein BLA60_39365 [Actinophytocola xinjiangensis]|uniref:Uncharacterized protein n=1 Tax=Actinophytocola xinjiangensis TaxID=485602 RepID=A0A7Z0WD77_9PSEU|nr:hypothetical protein BLA60_39365 [Actinophytocola xinjiangensis]